MRQPLFFVLIAFLAGGALVLVIGSGVGSEGETAVEKEPFDLSKIEARLEALEKRLDRMTRRPSEPVASTAPPASGVSEAPERTLPPAADEPDQKRIARLEDVERRLAAMEPGSEDLPAPKKAMAGLEAQMRKQVDKAVEEKAAQIQAKLNKKPTIDSFASVLELDEGQRETVEREVIFGQQEVQSILETPTADGSNLMDELVEIAAGWESGTTRDPGAYMKWMGRILSEKIPGTDDTYGARIETVKTSIRETFKREFTPEQYSEFEGWQVDPTEIQKVEGSPWQGLEERIKERAEELRN